MIEKLRLKTSSESMRPQLLAILVLSICSTPAFAQSSDGTPQQQPLHIGSVDFSGSILERVEFWDWFGGKGQNTYTYSGTLAQFAFSQTSPDFDWKIDMAVPILLGLPQKAVQPAPQGQLGLGGSYYAANDSHQNAAMIFPKEAYVRFKREKSSLQLGRFQFADG